ncbi:hypothetical protein [Aureispira anguillae]|uniref:Uncharacterized protein n=1 Tax=Aureispira anguillae TaxID=2864201 RepID=A0A916DQV3_9BACT|nr:hypothetical protein [Aureispira anguillae]BDS09942.1 hypothetical protein AsAng_0006470 [Aureispira anguillae]
MKKTILLTLIFSVAITTFLKAQSIEEVGAVAAKGLCDCVNETYSNIDSDVKRAMIRIIKYQSQNKAREMETYINSLSTDLAARIEEQAVLFQENNDLFELCVEDMEEAMAKIGLDETLYADVTEEAFEQILLEQMNAIKGCKFAYLLMSLGLAEGQESGTENKGQTKDNSYHKKFEGTGGN